MLRIFCLGIVILAGHSGSNALAQSPPSVNNGHVFGVYDGDIIDFTFTQSGGTPPISWDSFSFVDYIPPFGLQDSSPINAAMFDPDNQLFSWDSTNSKQGDYIWSVRATNDAGNSIGTVTVHLLVPEPGVSALTGLALMGVLGSARRRTSELNSGEFRYG